MSKKKSAGFLIIALMMTVVLAPPAVAQMKSARTVLNAKPKQATTVETRTRRDPAGAAPTVTEIPKGTTVETRQVTAADGQPATMTVVRTPESTTTTTVTDTTTETTTTTEPDPCAGFTKAEIYKGLPTRGDSAKAKCFFQQNGFEMLKNAQLLTSGGSVTAAMEPMSDFWGGWRVSFSVAVASNSDEDEEEEGGDEADPTVMAEGDETPEAPEPLSLFQANGGNLALSAAYPLYANIWGPDELDERVGPNGASGFTAITYLRLAGTFDAFGDTTDAPTSLDWKELSANAEWAVTTQSNLITVGEMFHFELYTNTGLIAGTRAFRNSLGIDPKDNSGVFLHGELGANIRLNNGLVIGASYNYYTADDIDSGASFTVGFGR